MPLLNNNPILATRPVVDDTHIQIEENSSINHTIKINYFDLLDETPDFSEAAILLENGIIEYSYVKTAADGKHYFGFERCLPGSIDYDEIITRHRLVSKMEANTFEHYPSGKTVLSRGGRILEIKHPERG